MPTYDCGHGCEITCPDGGGCIYNNDTGKCTTFCNGDDGVLRVAGGAPRFTLQPDSKVTVHFEDVTPAEIARVLRELGVS